MTAGIWYSCINFLMLWLPVPFLCLGSCYQSVFHTYPFVVPRG
jgi:hypothetical protein